MTAAMARGVDVRKSPARGQPQQQEVLDLRTGAGGVTPLMTACQEGHERTVRQILHMKPSMVHERDRNGKTALHYCTDNPTLACIDQVVAADPSLLSAQEEDGHTPLHLATIAGNRVVAKYLLTRGADVNALDDEKHTAIHWATVCGEQQLLEMLMEAGGDPSTPDIHGAYPIHYAAQMCGPNGDPTRDMMAGLEILKTLIQHGVPVDVRDRDGREPMLWAASSGSADAIMILKKAGASVMAADKDGLTALHCAASRGHLDCIDMLITLCNCDVDLVDSNGCSPLFYAVTLGHADCTQMLLNNGANADRQDRKGRTPAHCGAAKGQLETLKLLHQRNADLWKRNIKGDLPLHEACQSGRKDLVVWLLSMMTDMVNASNSDGRTPLHIAAINNNTGLCKILMDHNATVNPIMRNSKGQLLTPVDAAVARGHKGCAQFLQLHGATSAAKLTDKRALQLALSKAMEGGSGDRTGATPTSEMGFQDMLIPSSAGSRTHDASTLMAAELKDSATDTQESGYSGSHREDSELDHAASDDDGGIVTKSAMRRKLHNEKKLTKANDDRDYRSDDDETGGLTDRPRKKKGGRYNEDGDAYDDLDDAYADMEDLPRHLSARRRAQNRGRRHSDGGETGGTSSDSGSQKKTNRSAPTEMSITQAMQTTMRKYTLERRLFQQLLELKRQQIRNTKVNESVLIKRMSDANNRDSTMLGLRGYAGPMNFQSYEKHLYDQLKFLQSSQVEKAPQFRPIDDVDKLNRVLHRTEISESKQGVGSMNATDDDVPSDPRQCNRRTHRCHHAAHAYTGIPCAAFLAPRGKKYIDRIKANSEGKVTLPKIDGAASQAGSGPATYRARNTKRAKAGRDEASSNTAYMGVQGYDPKKPLTVELQPSTPPKATNPPSASDETSDRGYTPSSAGGRSQRGGTATLRRSASLSTRRNSQDSEQESPAEEKPQSADV